MMTAATQNWHITPIGQIPEAPDRLRVAEERLRNEGYPEELIRRLKLSLSDRYRSRERLHDTYTFSLLSENDGHVVISRPIPAEGQPWGRSECSRMMAWLNSPATWQALGFEVHTDHDKLLMTLIKRTITPLGEATRQARVNGEEKFNFSASAGGQSWHSDGCCIEEDEFREASSVGKALLQQE